MSERPSYRYHPDPEATGAFEERTHRCRCCGEVATWCYTVVPYAAENLRDALCPDCIGQGTAAARFDARYSVVEADDVPDGVPESVVEVLTTRTPGFSGWERERWLFHCDDAAAFLGPCGWEELLVHPDVVATLIDAARAEGLDPDDATAFVGSLDVDGAATAYLFRCLHCGIHLAYADADPD
jgi:hypothetical protein